MRHFTFVLALFLIWGFSPYTTLFAANYYWVGGSGNWSDISHWATTSGGTTQHNQIPTARDKVFFDSLSFTGSNQQVSVIAPIYCLDMDWTGVTGSPRLVGGKEVTLHVYGSLILSEYMAFDFLGDIQFLATAAGKVIHPAGHTFHRNTYFSGVGGGWILQDALVTDSLLQITSGTFNSDSQPIQTEVLRIDAVAPVSIDLGTSILTVTGTAYFPVLYYVEEPIADISLNKLTFSGTRSTLRFTAPDAYVRVRYSGIIAFGKVLFASTQGKARLVSENGDQQGTQMDTLEMRCDANISGAMRFNGLILGPGKNFIFEAGRRYALNKLQAQGTCAAPIQLFSSIPGTPVYLEATSGTLSGDFLSLQDINGVGGARFEATNSADLGNNAGWIINPKVNTRLYWVGDSGFWYDPQNWSLTSGGPGGACVPTAADDVIFDQHSFTTPGGIVVADVDNLYCKSMDWFGAAGTPIFKGSIEKNLHIFGSLALIPDMRFEFEGDVLFESNQPGNTISSAGQIFQNDVTFNGSGSWLLSDSLSLVRNLYFLQGRLNTNSQMVSCQRFESMTNQPRELSLENSYIQLKTPDYQYLTWRVQTENYKFNAGSSTIQFFWYGDMSKNGRHGLSYNRVIFNHGSGVYSDNFTPATSFDTLTMYGGGYFQNLAEINVWEVFRGNNYGVEQGDTLIVNQIIDPAGCAGMIELSCNVDNQTAYIKVQENNTLDRFVLKDIYEIGPGTATVSNSVDLGNTAGWVLSDNPGRQLYWVGGSGNWWEPEHWSLSSGGAGGECVPTPVDDVFFDALSFTSDQDVVLTGNSLAYCKHMTWSNTRGNPTFNAQIVQVFGSIRLEENIRSDYFNNLVLKGSAKDNIVHSAGAIRFWNVTMRGPGTYTLSDKLRAQYLDLVYGVLHSNSQPVEIEYFAAYSSFNFRELRMGGSHWKVGGVYDGYRGAWTSYTAYTLTADSSLVEFVNGPTQMYHQKGVAFHNVLFSAPDNTSTIQTVDEKTTFNRLEFRNSGVMLGAHVADSLLFSPGKSYRLDVLKDQEVKELFQVIGNNCLSIELSSTVPGVKSRVIMQSGKVLADFVQMRDQIAVGTVRFLAGVHSTNISNSNTDWVFESAEDYVDEGILGKDIVLCKNTDVLLDARTYSPGETYRWNNGSTASTLTTALPGTYWVAVRYNDNCVLIDSVKVLEPAEFFVDLPTDTTLCAGDTLLLDVALDLLGLNYLWQDSSRESSQVVRAAGFYRVALELSGCTAMDSLEVRVQANPTVNLGVDRALCDRETEVLSAATQLGTAYIWQDGSRSASFTVRNAGTYSVEVFEKWCSARDTLVITYEPPLNLNLGRDTTICEERTLLLAPVVAGASFRWQDGSTQSTLTAVQPGVYWVEATRNNCSETDSIRISQQVLPRFDLGVDTALCDGQQLVINGTALPGTSYAWNSGSKNPIIEVTSTATYTLQAMLNGCTYTDSRLVSFKPIPVLQLGPDQKPCPGEEIVLAPVSPGAAIRWQDGSYSPSFRVQKNGQYWAEANLNGCTRRDTVVFTYRPAPVFELGADTTLCVGQILPLQVGVPNATFKWNTGTTIPTETIRSAGTYWLEADLNGCKTRDSIRVAYFVFPADWLGADRTVCDGETLRLSASTPGATYRWQDGLTNPVYVVSEPGVYTVRVRVGHCEQGDTVVVDYNPRPIFNLGRDTVLCAPASITLAARPGADSYRWSTGDSGAQIQVQQSGLVWAEVLQEGCTWRDSVIVRVQTAPVPRLGQDTTICADDKIVLSAGVQAAQYEWQDGSSRADFQVSQAGVYRVVTSDGVCSASDSVQIFTRSCVQFKVYAPNAFSPNNDGVNDSFRPLFPTEVAVLEYDLRVFDRWGNMMYQSLNPADPGWDGSYKGNQVPQGTYVYVLLIHYRDDEKEASTTISGDVTVLR